uniref:Cytochrome P450 n=1 Tax=Strigamia maritima TaxID=126957 RepID=T1JCH9_STRMM
MESSQVLNVLMEYYHTLFFIAIITFLTYWMKNGKNLPPGPWGLPIFGYIPFIRDPYHLAMTKLSEKYGNIISVYLGNVLVIVLNDYNAIKEAFVKQGHLFNGKPRVNHLKAENNIGLSNSEGEKANQHRRFILSCFRDLGMGKSSLEPHIMNEIKCFLNEIKKTNGQPTDLKYTIGLSVANIVALLQFGERLEYNNLFLQTISKTILNSSKHAGPLSLRVFLPWIVLIPFPGAITGLKQFKKAVRIIESYLSKVIKKKEEKYTEGGWKNNYIDSYITERKQRIDKTGSEGYFDMQELVANARNLYGAGIETSTSYLLWSILLMLKYPEIRKKVQHEIDEVIGKGRDPVMADKLNMPYTEATLLEVHRMCTVLPFSLVHSNMEEAKLFDYKIPKRCYVIANFWAVHHDKSLWNDPGEFRPERFVGDDGKIFKPDYLVPFSMGPWGLPIVGYLPFLKEPPYLRVTELGKKYGNVISFYLGSVLVVVLNDYTAIKEAFVKQGNIFSGKPKTNIFRFNNAVRGLMVAEGETASQHRRFILSSFKDVGMGKTSLEPQLMVTACIKQPVIRVINLAITEFKKWTLFTYNQSPLTDIYLLIQEEIKCFLDVLRKKNGEAINVEHPLHLSISNIIAMFEFGKRFEYSDKEFSRLIKLVTSNGIYLGALAKHIFLPWIGLIPFTSIAAGFQKLR